jgi:hypothetical protein
MMHLRDIFFCAPLRDEFKTAKAVRGRASRLNCGNTQERARDAQQGGGLRILLFCVLILFSFGGETVGAAARAGSLQASPGTVSFGRVSMGGTAIASISLTNTGTATVKVSRMSVSGNAFSVSGEGNLPILVAAGAKYAFSVNFFPTGVGAAASQLTITSNASKNGTMAVRLSGTGISASTPTLTSLSCTSSSITGAGTDSCAVTLNAAALSGGFAVSVASNNSAVAVPASVTVAAGATTANFTATVSTVSAAQTVTLTASANSVAKTFALQLGTAVATLNVNATTIAFGNVILNSPATQTLMLTSTGSAAVTVSAATVTGSGFTVSGGSFPISLQTNQTATLNVQFDPTVAGAVTGQLTITSNSSTGSSAIVSLSGTGAAASQQVSLSWNAPTSSPDPVAGYNVYRALSGNSSYTQLNSTAMTQTTYTDTNVQNSQTYDYIVESVDASGIQSVPSNTAVVPVP